MRPPPDARRLLRIVDGFAGRAVAVAGDFVADEFVHGDIARISREAPVLILEHRRTEVVPGGGGNAIANLAALDAAPVPVGVVGADDAGARLLDRFEALGVPIRDVVVAKGYDTPSKSRVLAGGVHTRRQQIVRIDRGAGRGELPPRVREALAARLARAVPRVEGLLFADYGHGSATPAMLRALPSKARPTTTVDSRTRVARFRGATACTPNQEELEQAVGVAELRTERALASAAAVLMRRAGTRAVLVTRGARGMCLVERGKTPLPIPAFGEGEVADVTGAGDTVIATFTLALLAGALFAEAAFLSNLAAGLVVMKYGTATVSRGELASAIREASRS